MIDENISQGASRLTNAFGLHYQSRCYSKMKLASMTWRPRYPNLIWVVVLFGTGRPLKIFIECSVPGVLTLFEEISELGQVTNRSQGYVYLLGCIHNAEGKPGVWCRVGRYTGNNISF